MEVDRRAISTPGYPSGSLQSWWYFDQTGLHATDELMQFLSSRADATNKLPHGFLAPRTSGSHFEYNGCAFQSLDNSGSRLSKHTRVVAELPVSGGVAISDLR